ncbi:MATE family efflux transporter [Shewanella sp. JM162201]|uniref:Multidrug export protein MepA n=1 Tax=Shewanella jiangmenensis TaxID=2837387 RepID=A0ABS5UYQ7_9GAMM|nr:MATE family efflux transporter [Shewanella jiangmenensis]MBT1443262.1 MATE family efflux transporter [Shewanella jiangmenensis]
MSHSHTQDLLQAPVSRLFWRYTLPTVASMLVTGVYVTIDGMFVGHFLGETGLAGIMLAYPVGAVLYAVGAMIGMGAGALMSIRLGEGKTDKARQLLGNAFTLILLAALFFTVVGSLSSRHILIWLGAEGEVLESAHEYLFWYFALCIFPLISMAFTTLLRNDGRPAFVTWVLIAGGVINTVLDYLFIVVWNYGLAGASIATMLSQAVTGLLCLQHFFSPRTQLRISLAQMRLTLDNCLNIARVGLPSLLMNLYLSIVLTLHNTALLWVGTPLHVAAYGVVSYTEAFFYLIFEGIALGSQPVLSFNAGAGRFDRVRKIRRLAMMVTLLMAGLGLIFIYGKPEWAVFIFAGDNPALSPVAIEGMRLYFWGLPFEGMILVGASFFQAINRPKEASILTGTKLVLIGLVIYSFAWAFGVPGVWVSLATVSGCLTLWMLWQMAKIDRQLSNIAAK